MAIEQIDLELIHDNHYQARLIYHRKDIDDLAHSIETHGLLQVPPGRRIHDRVELAFGHLRKRAFLKLAKKDPKKWGKMPIDIRELSDEQMAMFALEENLKRRDISPLEIARAVDNYLNSFLKKTETEVAESLNMTKGNVSNMRRVLRLPDEVLQKIDEGRINFTQGRELLLLERLGNPKESMLSAIRGLRTPAMGYGHANTVEGMAASVHNQVSSHSQCRPLDKAFEGYRYDLIFDTRAAGCPECDKMIRTHPTKSITAHYCLDEMCWGAKQEVQREKVSAEAKARMEADILHRAAESVKENITQVIKMPDTPTKPKPKPLPVVADEAGIVEPLPCISCAKAEKCDRAYFHVADNGSDRLVCEEKVEAALEELKLPTVDIPKDILTLAREKAGTRSEVLDLNNICTTDSWRRQVQSGYTLLQGGAADELRYMGDPEECTERCTHGFHFGFDSKDNKGTVFFICTDTKCVAKKKSAWTRAKNAEGQARKKAEVKAVKEAIAQTTTLDRPRIKLIFLAQMDGLHTQRHYYGNERAKRPETWLWDKVSAGTAGIDRTRKKLFKAIDKLSDEALAQLVVEFMLYSITDKGDLGSYEIKATEPLEWMGIPLTVGEYCL